MFVEPGLLALTQSLAILEFLEEFQPAPPLLPQDVKGIKVARQGFHDYSRGSIVKGTDPRGYDYYWFGLHGMVHTPGHDTDLEVIEDGYIAVTPLQLDLTHSESLANLRSAYSG